MEAGVKHDWKTGWPPPELMQDDNKKLSKWFATRLGARLLIRERQACLTCGNKYYPYEWPKDCLVEGCIKKSA